jgi:hypothetical protein
LKKNTKLSTWWDSINDVKAYITFAYVSGHSGITYNEKADQLAGEATVFGDLVHEPDDVVKEMEARLNEQENAVQQESWSVQRLIERVRSRGDGRKYVETGWKRRLVNQVELGVLSRSTLRRLIEGGGPGHQPASLLLCSSGWLVVDSEIPFLTPITGLAIFPIE